MEVALEDDVTVAYDDLGAGEPVLLLHGFPTSRTLWGDVAPALARSGYRTIAPDLVGYGESRAPADRDVGMESQAAWLLALLDRLAVGRAAIVAHDVGSAAAQILLARAPERVRALVVVDGVHPGDWAMEGVRSFQEWKPENAARIHRVLLRTLRSSPEARVRRVLAAVEGEEGGLRLIRAARALDPRQTERLTARLGERLVPALVIWGEGDPFLPAEKVGRPLAELLGTELVVLPGGHFLPLDAPDALAAELRKFLAAL
jgi:pimeloyl-ACP methyl ester carboxylesterase